MEVSKNIKCQSQKDFKEKPAPVSCSNEMLLRPWVPRKVIKYSKDDKNGMAETMFEMLVWKEARNKTTGNKTSSSTNRHKQETKMKE